MSLPHTPRSPGSIQAWAKRERSKIPHGKMLDFIHQSHRQAGGEAQKGLKMKKAWFHSSVAQKIKSWSKPRKVSNMTVVLDFIHQPQRLDDSLPTTPFGGGGSKRAKIALPRELRR